MEIVKDQNEQKETDQPGVKATSKQQEREIALQVAMQKKREQQEYQAFKSRMKAEIEDNELRGRWLQSRKALADLNKEFSDERAMELQKIKYVIDTLCDKFKLENINKMYEYFQIPVPGPVKSPIVEPDKSEENETKDKGTENTD